MSAWPERTPAPLHALVERAASYLLRPAEEGERSPLTLAPPPAPPLRPVAAVLGLGPRAGTSTIARSLAARLAALDPAGAAILHTEAALRGGPATGPAARLASVLVAEGCEGARAVGRLAVAPGHEPLAPLAATRHAPLVTDVAHGGASEAALALADHVVLVCPPDVEPALALAVEGSLRAARRGVTLVARGAARPRELEHALTVPESRFAAHLTLACREPRGALAELAAELAERCLAEVIV